jgi:hypothetical protein
MVEYLHSLSALQLSFLLLGDEPWAIKMPIDWCWGVLLQAYAFLDGIARRVKLWCLEKRSRTHLKWYATLLTDLKKGHGYG